MTDLFECINASLKFSKDDPRDPRLGERISDISPSMHILGYPDDEGIQLNGGRPGARLAPDQIRYFLYKMTLPLNEPSTSVYLNDLGNLKITSALEERHENVRLQIKKLCQENKYWISLGGGHDYGYSDSTGFLDAFADSYECVVINLDAHLDVRPTNNGFNSGTPFYRMLTEYQNKVHFIELGVQPHCNSFHHYEWAKNKGSQIYTLEQAQGNILSILKMELSKYTKKKIFLSIDMDAFSSYEAPGCSQSWPTGLHTQEVLNSLQYLVQNEDVQGLGVYETSPPLDFDHHTSKLAALIIYNYIFYHSKIRK